MRTIKFRGKDFDGKWLYGDLRHHNGIDVCIFSQTKNSGQPVQEETIGQFIGLKDKNDKEIYEGDILKTRLIKRPFGVVTWHPDGYFFIDFTFGQWEHFFNSFTTIGEMLKKKTDVGNLEFEVIGNIYDNPELLGK